MHPDKDTKGICGLKPKFYKDILQGIEVNSLFAGYLALQSLDFNIKHYKGTINNHKSYNRVMKLYRGINGNNPRTR